MTDKQTKGKDARDIGYLHEKLAKSYLLFKGYEIIDSNLLGKRGFKISELDIIAKKGNILIFFEVKYRKNNEDCYYAITEKSKQRIINAASLYLSNNEKYKDYEIRFDVILFSKGAKFEHIKGAFTA